MCTLHNIDYKGAVKTWVILLGELLPGVLSFIRTKTTHSG